MELIGRILDGRSASSRCSRTCSAAVRGPLPACAGRRGEGQARVRAVLRERVEVRGVREAAREVRGVSRTRRSVRWPGHELLRASAGSARDGVYPLLGDDVLAPRDRPGRRFLALGRCSMRAAGAISGLVQAVERSRSGNGAHAWFFFTEPVPAS